MKASKLMLGIGALILGATTQLFAQKVLPVIEIEATNYKYLNSVDPKDVAQPVAMLEREAAAFELKNSEFYEDEYANYFVSFYIPEGKILAAYDKDGNLLRTAEKFKNVAVPKAVREAVAIKYPQWTIANDVYLVSYHDKNGVTKRYKLLLEKGNQRMRVKIDDKGKLL